MHLCSALAEADVASSEFLASAWLVSESSFFLSTKVAKCAEGYILHGMVQAALCMHQWTPLKIHAWKAVMHSG